jgi:transcriptional regulator with XRE-family HTH domain
MKDNSKKDIEAVCERTEGWNEAFKRLREQAGFSQEQLAEQIGCDRSAISHRESATFYPGPDMLQKALSALNVDARLLFKHFGQKATELLKAQLNPEELALAQGRELREEASGKSQHDVASRIVELMDNRVLAVFPCEPYMMPRVHAYISNAVTGSGKSLELCMQDWRLPGTSPPYRSCLKIAPKRAMAELLTLKQLLNEFRSLSDDEFVELVESGAFDDFIKACRLETVWPPRSRYPCQASIKPF